MDDSLGIAVGTDKNCELGKKIPPADLLLKLVSLFNVNPVWLLTDEGEMIKGREVQEIREFDVLEDQGSIEEFRE